MDHQPLCVRLSLPGGPIKSVFHWGSAGSWTSNHNRSIQMSEPIKLFGLCEHFLRLYQSLESNSNDICTCIAISTAVSLGRVPCPGRPLHLWHQLAAIWHFFTGRPRYEGRSIRQATPPICTVLNTRHPQRYHRWQSRCQLALILLVDLCISTVLVLLLALVGSREWWV